MTCSPRHLEQLNGMTHRWDPVAHAREVGGRIAEMCAAVSHMVVPGLHLRTPVQHEQIRAHYG